MAASDAKPVPRKNAAFRVTFPIYDSDGDLVTAAAGLDSEYSGDGGTFADCTNEATEIATSSGIYYLDLIAAEMNYDTVAIIVKTSTVDAKTTAMIIYPEESRDIRADLTAQGILDVNAQVVDALNVDTYAEPGQGAPAATASLAAKINYLYKSWRNKKTQTATVRSIYNDAGDTVDQKATDSDDGSTFTKGEIGSGA